MFVPEEISHDKILATLRVPHEPLLERVELFDLFSGGGNQSGFGPARKSLAYRLTYRDRSRTLTSEEVSAAHAKIRERLRSDLGAELREEFFESESRSLRVGQETSALRSTLNQRLSNLPCNVRDQAE